jgi:hypothetical protein
VRRGTGLDPHQAGRQPFEKGQHLPTPQLLADHGLARSFNAMNLETVLRKVETNRTNFFHRMASSSS